MTRISSEILVKFKGTLWAGAFWKIPTMVWMVRARFLSNIGSHAELRSRRLMPLGFIACLRPTSRRDQPPNGGFFLEVLGSQHCCRLTACGGHVCKQDQTFETIREPHFAEESDGFNRVLARCFIFNAVEV